MDNNIYYGYARVSTPHQKIDRQINNINNALNNVTVNMITEKYTGTTTDRPAFNKLVKQVKDNINNGFNVTIIFDEVSRMSRNAEEGIKQYFEWFNMGVNLIFIKEPHINTSVFATAREKQIDTSTADKKTSKLLDAINEFLFDLATEQIEIAFNQAQKEVDHLHQRTCEGIKVAKANGKRIGTPKGSKLTTKKSIEAKELILKYNNSFGGKLNNEETWKIIGINKSTFYKYKKELLEEKQ